MTIVYFITTVGHGKGGHFHSLNTIANAVGKSQNVHVINLGFKPSEVLDAKNYSFKYIKFNGYNFFSAYANIKAIVKDIRPDVLHAFDVESFAFSRLLSKQYHQSSFLNKCGGPNPKKYYPKPDRLILFSEENKAYFEGNLNYKHTNVLLIPNRVSPVNVSADRVKSFTAKHGDFDLSLLRIARIGKHYHRSIIQAVNLLEWLISKGLNIRLILLGTIQSDVIYNSILQYIKTKNLEAHIILETTNEFTHNASELLDVGDIVIGTGRNFMEASSLNKMLLVPYKDSDYPLLVTNDNFKAIFSTNFSPRTQVTDFDDKENLEAIYRHLENEDLREKSKLWFNLYFNVEKGAEMYVNLYEKAYKSNKPKRIDTLMNIVYAIKTFVLK